MGVHDTVNVSSVLEYGISVRTDFHEFLCYVRGLGRM